MYLVQLLLPLYDNEGNPFGQPLFAEVRGTLLEKFGGVTAHLRAPARGLWDDEGEVVGDDIVICEVMMDDVDHAWWGAYREVLRKRFAQDELIVRALWFEQL